MAAHVVTGRLNALGNGERRMLTAWSDDDRDEVARLLVQLNAALDDRLRAKPPSGRGP